MALEAGAQTRRQLRHRLDGEGRLDDAFLHLGSGQIRAGRY